MTSRGEKLFYVLSLVGLITGVLGAATYVFYLSRGGSMMYADSGNDLATGTMVIGIFSYLTFRALPGFLGWRGCKTHQAVYVKIAFVLTCFAIIMSLGVQKYVPGVGTGWIFALIYMIISLRYMSALTAEQRAKDSKWLQKPEDGPRLM